MTFLDLVAGDAVFLDANTFYYFAPDPRWSGSCGQLLQRIQNQEITGYTAAAILCLSMAALTRAGAENSVKRMACALDPAGRL